MSRATLLLTLALALFAPVGGAAQARELDPARAATVLRLAPVEATARPMPRRTAIVPNAPAAPRASPAARARVALPGAPAPRAVFRLFVLHRSLLC
jgi:hypothetical protein